MSEQIKDLNGYEISIGHNVVVQDYTFLSLGTVVKFTNSSVIVRLTKPNSGMRTISRYLTNVKILILK